jgi:hypothetical protein
VEPGAAAVTAELAAVTLETVVVQLGEAAKLLYIT